MWHLFIIELPSLDVITLLPRKKNKKKKKKEKTVKGNCLWWS